MQSPDIVDIRYEDKLAVTHIDRDSYLVSSSTDRYIFRVYRASHRSLTQIAEETKLLFALREAGVAVSYPVTDATGNTIQVVNAIEGQRCGVLFTYANGRAYRVLNDTQVRIFAREMARFHLVSEGLVRGNDRWAIDFNTTLKPVWAS